MRVFKKIREEGRVQSSPMMKIKNILESMEQQLKFSEGLISE